MKPLSGQVALVVGGSRGMGKQMAIELGRLGADVAIAARTSVSSETNLPGTIGATAEEIRALGARAEPVKVDLAIGAEVDSMVQRTLDTFGKIDILVTSVQHHGPAYYASFLDSAIDQLEAQMQVNTMSIIRTCKLVVPHMIERGGGRIVLVTSKAATLETGRPPGQGGTGLGYSVSKAALSRFVPALAKEVKAHGISVIGMNPGFVISEHVEAESVGAQYHGWDTSYGVPPTVPAKAMGYLCTCSDHMDYSGKITESDELVAEHHLVENPKDSYLQSKRVALDGRSE
jgi:NAD(P)-dependent dehydrogenase (short-subunit alcohol dehydrogenase family)